MSIARILLALAMRGLNTTESCRSCTFKMQSPFSTYRINNRTLRLYTLRLTKQIGFSYTYNKSAKIAKAKNET